MIAPKMASATTSDTQGAPVRFERDVAIMGGCGHVGLPLGLAWAERGLSVVLFDTNAESVDTVNSGAMPFREEGADELLPSMLQAGRLRATADPATMQSAENAVVVIGTPVDRYWYPDVAAVLRGLEPVVNTLVDDQLLVLRSTVFPGVTQLVERLIAKSNKHVDVCFCPERIAEGDGLAELSALPQIVSGRTPRATQRAAALFRHLTDEILELTPEEAELAKLFTNTWRYIKFATANQLFMIANDYGLDFERIRHAVRYKYPRAADMPGPGFAAGPCLFKDTLQIAAFYEANFTLGHASVNINEGLPSYLISRLERRFDLATMTVGILGMAFKARSDDIRGSLSYKLKRLLNLKAKRVLCTDPFVNDAELVPLDCVLTESDLLVIATPHEEYANIEPRVPTVDPFNLLGQGTRI